MQNREKFASRLGFILISAGCAIGLGNVWKFPYITAANGGAAFILIYLLFLVLLGIPIMTMEFAVGRASKKSIAESFQALEPKGSKWHWFSFFGMAGNYLLMMFYTVVSGWMLIYVFKMAAGNFVGLDPTQVAAEFGSVTGGIGVQIVGMVVMTVAAFTVCGMGLEKGIEKITKVMMIALICIMAILAVRSITLPGADAGLKYYLMPDLSKVFGQGFSHFNEVVFAAMGQAFFTLSIGMGSMAIFGSYINKDRRLLGESITITALDTVVAITAGLIIIPACFAYNIDLQAGPPLIFITLPNVFNSMPGGRIWGSLFFVFMLFAAFSTLIAVFENIISFAMDKLHWSRKKACIINCIAIIILSMPALLGFNAWSGFQPLAPGKNILDLEDFIVSNNILPIGSLIYVLFCCTRYGWGFDKFAQEANIGKGAAVRRWMKPYCQYVLPIIIIYVLVMGYIAFF